MARALIDVDGVMAEFNHHSCSAIAQVLGEDRRPDPNSFTEWDFIKLHLDEEQRTNLVNVLGHPFFWESQPLIEGAKEAVDAILAAGHQVHFVTSPWESLHGWADIRRDWLIRHTGINKKFVHIAPLKYLYSGACFIDDKPDHIHAWAAEPHGAVERAFLFDHPYNRNDQHPTRLHGWTNDSVKRVLSVLEAA